MELKFVFVYIHCERIVFKRKKTTNRQLIGAFRRLMKKKEKV